MVMRGKVEKSVKSIITVAALVLSCRLALGDSISNLSQIVGRDITQEGGGKGSKLNAANLR